MKEKKGLFEAFFEFADDHPWYALSMVSAAATAAASIGGKLLDAALSKDTKEASK